MTTPANPFALPNSTPAQPTPVAAAPVATTTDVDPFDAPAPQEARGPRVRDLYGRLVLLIPHKLEKDVPNKIEPGKFQDRMTADLIVLDGGPIPFGGKPEGTPPVPHNKTANVPHKNARMFISAAGLISQCRDALAKRANGQPGMVLGRLTTGNPPQGGGNPPWILSPATDADKQLARQYLATVDPFAS